MDAAERYKGQDRIIAALPALVARGHDVVYVVVGDGNDVARLKTLAVEAHVAERVSFIGPIFTERLTQAYRMADLYVMPSTGEGFGIAFLEAMASGTQCSASPLPARAMRSQTVNRASPSPKPQLASALIRTLEGPTLKDDARAVAAR